MNGILKTTLSLSCSGALLIMLFFLFRPFFQKRLSKQWQYYIWLVVVARLLLPFGLEINLMETLFQRIDKGMVQTELASPPVQSISSSPEENMTNGDALWNDEKGSKNSNLQNGQPMVFNGPVLWLCWLVVAIILFIRKITVYQCFVKYIKTGCVEVVDINMLEQFGQLIEQCKIKTTVELCTNNLISSPLLIGFFRPCIVLPTDKLSCSDFQYTILHELTHYKRWDMFYKWLLQAVVCVHWFNPLVYLMNDEVGQACELSCDEAVIEDLGVQERLIYGDTLLNAIGSGGSYQNSNVSLTLGESRERLEERLDSIKNFRRKSKHILPSTFVLTIAICFGAAAMGAYAAAPLPDSKAAISTLPHKVGKLTLIEKEYTIEEVKKRNISGISINTFSDDISVVRDGDTLKFQYYALNPEEYTFRQRRPVINRQWDWTISLNRSSSSDAAEGRSITITIPEQFQPEDLTITTTSGNISLTDCIAGKIRTRTQNGKIEIYGGIVSKDLSVDTKNGNVLVSGTSLPETSNNASYCSYLNTESGTIIFQPADSADNYCFLIDYGEEAEVIINNEGIEEIDRINSSNAETVEDSSGFVVGRPVNDQLLRKPQLIREPAAAEIVEIIRKSVFTINENAATKIYFNSPRGSFIVQEK